MTKPTLEQEFQRERIMRDPRAHVRLVCRGCGAYTDTNFPITHMTGLDQITCPQCHTDQMGVWEIFGIQKGFNAITQIGITPTFSMGGSK